MVKVTVKNNASSKSVICDPSLTINQCIEQSGVDMTRGLITIDGSSVQTVDMTKTLAELGYTGEAGKDKMFIMSVTKADNAFC